MPKNSTPPNCRTTINDIHTPTHPHVIRRIDARSSARRGRATLWNGSKQEPTRGVSIAALASPLVQAFLLLFFADLNLSLVAASTGLISAYAGLEQFRALEGLKGTAEHDNERSRYEGEAEATRLHPAIRVYGHVHGGNRRR